MLYPDVEQISRRMRERAQTFTVAINDTIRSSVKVERRA
jgi:hypothetical protein